MIPSKKMKVACYGSMLALTVLCFSLDLHWELGVAGGVPYITLVLLALLLCIDIPSILIAALIGSIMVALGYYLSPPGGEIWKVITNRALAIFAIWVTTTVSIFYIQKTRKFALNEKKYRSLVETLFDPVITIDKKGIVQGFNSAAEKLFGYGPGEIIGKSVNLLMPSRYANEHDGYIQKYLDTGIAKIIGSVREAEGKKRDGSRFPLELAVTRFDDRDTVYFIGVARDITERKAHERSLQESQVELEKRVRERTRDLELSNENLMREVRERQRAEKAVKALSHQKKMILDNAGEAIIGYDVNGKVTFSNPSAAFTLGRSIDEMTEQPVSQLLYGSATNYSASNCPILRTLIAGISHREENGVFITKDKRPVPVHFYANPILDDGQIMGGVLSFNDISSQKETTDKLRDYAGQLEQINEELKDFTDIASHDLKEPVRKILTFGNRLKKSTPNLTREEKDNLERMIASAQNMKQLIQSLLQYSRVSRTKPNLETVSLKSALEETLQDLEIPIKETGCSVEITEESPGSELEADPVQIRQLFQNLIGNALKFQNTRVQPQIHIWISPGEIHPSRPGWTVKIKDNGIGFDQQYADKIFKPFERLNGQKEFQGSGMGLSICNKIVRRMDGSISVESVSGQGTVFTENLPARPGGE